MRLIAEIIHSKKDLCRRYLRVNYQLAELNIARFSLPMEHPDNAGFFKNLDSVNAIAESKPGFVWRFNEADNHLSTITVFEDPNIVANMSVWADIDSLASFVYQDKAHLAMMRRRREWFDKMEFYMVLWWMRAGHRPTLEEAKIRLDLLSAHGPTAAAFTFRQPFPAPCREQDKPVANGYA